MNKHLMYSHLEKLSGDTIVARKAKGSKIRELSLLGKSTQKKLTGQQLWVPIDKTTTTNGVTLTFEDNWLCLNGTCTTAYNFELQVDLEAGTYALSCISEGAKPNNANALVQIYGASLGNMAVMNNVASGSSVNKELPAGTYNMRIRIDKDFTYENLKLRPMLNKGSTALPWEPYTGGIASPSPDMPSHIAHLGNTYVPDDYQRVEYIEKIDASTNYFTTDYYPSTDTRIDAVFMLPENATTFGLLFGTRDSGSGAFKYGFGHTSSNGQNSRVDYNLSANFTTTPAGVPFNYVYDGSKIYIDGASKVTPTVARFACDNQMYLFSGNTVGQSSYAALAGSRIYSLKISENCNVVRNYIPCYRKSDNVIGFYESVTGVFYTPNDGASFEVGADLNAPIDIGGEIAAAIYNGNMFDLDAVQNGFVSMAAVGELSAIGTNASYPNSQYQKIKVNPGDTLYFKSYIADEESFRIRFVGEDELTVTSVKYNAYNEIVMTKDTHWIYLLSHTSRFTVNNRDKIWISTIAPPPNVFVPRHSKPIIVPVDGGLPGIPVTSGGNYTDKDGQQWITDEIVIEPDGNGKYIQRVSCITFTGNETITRNTDNLNMFKPADYDSSTATRVGICSHYPIVTNTAAGAPTGVYFGLSINFVNTGYEAEDFKQYLKQLYANGTPMRLLYVKTTPIETDFRLDGVLPSEYQKVEYLESSSTQYINTGVFPQDDYTVSLSFKLPSVPSGTSYLFGGQSTSSTGRFGLAKSSAGYFTAMYGNSGSIGTTDPYVADTEWHTIVLDGFEKKYTIDGVEYLAAPAKVTFASTNEALIFGLSGQDYYGPTPMLVSECVIFDRNRNEIAHFIPCYRKSDDKPGMYDIARGMFYTNAAAEGDDFAVGADVVSEPIHSYSGNTIIENDSAAGMSAVVRCGI